jgi:hypothetical protein
MLKHCTQCLEDCKQTLNDERQDVVEAHNNFNFVSVLLAQAL